MALLGPHDPAPFFERNPGGASDILFISDHNGAATPAALDGLGVPAAELCRHVAVDIGIAAVAEILAARFDAPLVAANYSRLVIDCNRRPGVPASIPEASDGTVALANHALTPEQRAAREDEIFWPYHRAIDHRIEAMQARGRPPIMVALHSFTPVLEGLFRPWDIGILCKEDDRLARPMIDKLSSDDRIRVGDNKPYSGHHPSGFTIERHADPRGLISIAVEFRQDRIEFRAGAELWADRFASSLERVLDERVWQDAPA